MVTNKEISKILNLCAQLMELHGENPFKSKGYSVAAFKVGKLDRQLSSCTKDEISKLEGVGKSIAACISDIIEKGEFDELIRLASATPPGVMEMLSIKGIGPKKIALIWKELQIESLGELLYACYENRLKDLKGFGLKTQQEIIKSIEFKMSSSGKFLFAVADAVAGNLLEYLENKMPEARITLTGEIRRKNEIIECIEVLSTQDFSMFLEEFNLLFNQPGIPVNMVLTSEEKFTEDLFLTTGSAEHIAQLKNISGNELKFEGYKEEKEIYKSAGLHFIIAEMREGLHEFDFQKNNSNENLIKSEDLKGVLHCHSTWSDGVHSLEEMAVHCKEAGYEYFGICDHSQSAFYARGLKEEQVLLQHDEIDRLNAKLAPFKIFKGIESDILYNGELDYPEQVLESFDFIVASVHSVLKMDKSKATDRLLRAIENPYTTILGHMTGRLLLSRQGYPVDYEKVIDACAEHNVIIELNANPHRLDMDWRKIPYALERGVKIAVNPDAHQKETVSHMDYGVAVARKGGLTSNMTFNAMNLSQVEEYFMQKRSKSLMSQNK
jgi:DNA polymerase (family X)